MFFQKLPLGTQLDWSNPLNDGVVMHLAMNEGHGDHLQDLSLYGNHGTMHNFAYPPTVVSGWNPGRNGIGLNFNGVNDYIDCGNDGSLDIRTGSLTVSVYIKTSTVFAQTGRGTVLWRGAGAGAGFVDMTLGSDDSNQLSCAIDDGNPLNRSIILSANELNDGIWHKIVFIRDAPNDKLYLYIDDLARVEANDMTGDVTPLDDLYIGWRNGGTYYFDGSTDQVRILNRAMTAKEVLDYAINPWQVYLGEDD